MTVLEALEARRTVRAFQSRPVPRETLETILRAANRAPSWANTQPWKVFVAMGEVLERLRRRFLDRFDRGEPPRFEVPAPESWPPELEQRIIDQGKKRFALLGLDWDNPEHRRMVRRRNYELFGAPVVVYLCLHRDLGPWSMLDLGAYAMALMLAAKDQGVDSAIAVNLAGYPDLIREELGILEEWKIVIGIALGYADESSPYNQYRSERRPLEEVVRFCRA